ncbi:hypothetical protein N5K37_23570 [Delftia tsuruhatensis]|uniref:Uncharacterized protein n=2 Tax=Comamonadaceae TaxID=80864 RepID=A0ABM6DYB1_9BURK|nr:hypothetical protein [Delftia tsuruhatensis]AOU99906.1 hypothetical protein BI380_00320 [Delftia tsuruhatensis]KAF1017963.1 MAG: hypothetical protein GAK30_03822 [Paracidovorax wautersii]MDH2232891.1 hypothetical protein [Delftia tsuruhatensis]
MATTNHTLGALPLPSGMIWVDEFDWTSVARSSERSITGALLVDEAAIVAGRPVTLEGEESQGWIRRATLLALMEMADDLGQTYELRLADGRILNVQFSGSQPITAKPIGRPELPVAAHPYVATVRLITV